ncbi:MAG: DUF5723 family protein [Candidatus Paceibacterota bacterium]
MGLGGGGTAYIQGSESLFVNPANLYFQKRDNRAQISFLQNGFHFDSLLPFDKTSDRLKSYRESIIIHDNSNEFIRLNHQDRAELINRNYSNGSDRRNLMSQVDLHWLGVSWRGENRAYAFALRTRIGNQYQIGKGIYDEISDIPNNLGLVNQSFNQRYQVLHEVSFGYAESFTFLNGQSPGISEFVIGIAPKLVISGGSYEVGYSNVYSFDEVNSLWNRDVSYSQISSGVFSGNDVSTFSNRSAAIQNIQDSGYRNLFDPTGFGAGIDLGISYSLHLGPNYNAFKEPSYQSDRSLRLSLSITDIGLIRIQNDPYQFELIEQQSGRLRSGSQSNILFTGALNEFYQFLMEFGDLHNFQSGSETRETYNLLLPASIQTGFMFHYDWFKLMADASYSIIESAFKPDGFVTYIGTEIRPFKYLPIRAGTRLSNNYTAYYSFGAGFETPFFDVDAAILFNSGDNKDSFISSEIIGASVIGITIHL